ncbi:MAG: phosphotransferase [Caldimonas sp.]
MMAPQPPAPCNDSTTLVDALAEALRTGPAPWRDAALELLDESGLAHTHVRLVGHGALARIPKQSQMKLAPENNLRYEVACFERATASGHTPKLLAVMPVSTSLPHGALLVEEIVGRAAGLPDDLGAIAAALAALHRLPVPASATRGPLQDAADPLRELLAEIETHAAFLARADLSSDALDAIDDELGRLRRLCAESGRPPRRLVAFDAHPGNFIVDDAGRAVLVDLEKCRYSHASLDLAHATLYTSTTWSQASAAVLSPAEVVAFYAAWADAFGVGAACERVWHLPLRRAMWLWSITWCAKWRVLSGAPRQPGGEDWSAELSDRRLVAHVQERVDHYLGEPGIRLVREEFVALAPAFRGTAP